MDEFVDLDKEDLILKIQYMEDKMKKLQTKSTIENVYQISSKVYWILYYTYLSSKLSIPFYIFIRMYLKI